MEFYKKLIIKVIESTASGEDSTILKKLKSGHDLNQYEKRELEELIESII